MIHTLFLAPGLWPGVSLPGFANLIIFLAMSRSQSRPRPDLKLTKVLHSASPDDIRTRLLERDRLASADTRSDAQRWLGDPPAWRSALAQKQTQRG